MLGAPAGRTSASAAPPPDASAAVPAAGAQQATPGRKRRRRRLLTPKLCRSHCGRRALPPPAQLDDSFPTPVALGRVGREHRNPPASPGRQLHPERPPKSRVRFPPLSLLAEFQNLTPETTGESRTAAGKVSGVGPGGGKSRENFLIRPAPPTPRCVPTPLGPRLYQRGRLRHLKETSEKESDAVCF
ncbi:serine/arginine repetitive matrix protein 1-like [Choloepus didactylus]|uniref:serine/arginine repetitive matrix protein 1-like n=1 Tax=Choloepus didactylus TaxID=27675 RepID=UPI00189E6B4A|nr:serine/arginine repetitive matrix protein 1-like [Choloepus didactylus]